jgi:hypothetical protein
MDRQGNAVDPLRALAHPREGLPVQVLHDQDAQIEIGVDVESFHHIAVMQTRREARFVLEHRAELVVHRQLGVELFQNDLAARAIPVGKESEKDAGHPAPSDFGDQPVVAQRSFQPGTNRERIRVGIHGFVSKGAEA